MAEYNSLRTGAMAEYGVIKTGISKFVKDEVVSIKRLMILQTWISMVPMLAGSIIGICSWVFRPLEGVLKPQGWRSDTNRSATALTGIMSLCMLLLAPLLGAKKICGYFRPILDLMKQVPYATWMCAFLEKWWEGAADFDDLPQDSKELFEQMDKAKGDEELDDLWKENQKLREELKKPVDAYMYSRKGKPDKKGKPDDLPATWMAKEEEKDEDDSDYETPPKPIVDEIVLASKRKLKQGKDARPPGVKKLPDAFLDEVEEIGWDFVEVNRKVSLEERQERLALWRQCQYFVIDRDDKLVISLRTRLESKTPCNLEVFLDTMTSTRSEFGKGLVNYRSVNYAKMGKLMKAICKHRKEFFTHDYNRAKQCTGWNPEYEPKDKIIVDSDDEEIVEISVNDSPFSNTSILEPQGSRLQALYRYVWSKEEGSFKETVSMAEHNAILGKTKPTTRAEREMLRVARRMHGDPTLKKVSWADWACIKWASFKIENGFSEGTKHEVEGKEIVRGLAYEANSTKAFTTKMFKGTIVLCTLLLVGAAGVKAFRADETPEVVHMKEEDKAVKKPDVVVAKPQGKVARVKRVKKRARAGRKFYQHSSSDDDQTNAHDWDGSYNNLADYGDDEYYRSKWDDFENDIRNHDLGDNFDYVRTRSERRANDEYEEEQAERRNASRFADDEHFVARDIFDQDDYEQYHRARDDRDDYDTYRRARKQGMVSWKPVRPRGLKPGWKLRKQGVRLPPLKDNDKVRRAIYNAGRRQYVAKAADIATFIKGAQNKMSDELEKLKPQSFTPATIAGGIYKIYVNEQYVCTGTHVGNRIYVVLHCLSEDLEATYKAVNHVHSIKLDGTQLVVVNKEIAYFPVNGIPSPFKTKDFKILESAEIVTVCGYGSGENPQVDYMIGFGSPLGWCNARTRCGDCTAPVLNSEGKIVGFWTHGNGKDFGRFEPISAEFLEIARSDTNEVLHNGLGFRSSPANPLSM
jgi:hypothetical protein